MTGVQTCALPICFRKAEAETKVGFVASKKLFKRATDRNRVKRRLRAALRSLQAEWPRGFDLLFIAKHRVMTEDYEEMKEQIRKTFQKIPEALKQPPRKRQPRAKKKSSIVYKNVER